MIFHIAKVQDNQVVIENRIVADSIPPGYLTVEEVKPDCAEYEKLTGHSYTIQADKVIKTYTKGQSVTLTDYRTQLVSRLSTESFSERAALIPDYRLNNLLLGVTDYPYTLAQALATVEAFRTEYDRVKTLINNSADHAAALSAFNSRTWPQAVSS